MTATSETDDGLSDDPRDYDLPVTVAVELPPDLPTDITPEELPESETIKNYRDRDVDTLPTIPDTTDNEDANRLLGIFGVHPDRGLHPNELQARSGIPSEDLPALIHLLHTQNLIRRTRVVENIPFYQLNQFSAVARDVSANIQQ